MPLLPGRANVGRNIKELMAAGYPQKQAVAIAMQHAEEGDKKKRNKKK